MKMWKAPEVAELEVSLTASGPMGNCNEKHQWETPKEDHAAHPGKDPNPVDPIDPNPNPEPEPEPDPDPAYPEDPEDPRTPS